MAFRESYILAQVGCMVQERKQLDRRWLWLGAVVILIIVFFSARSLLRERLPVRVVQVGREVLTKTTATNGRVEPESKFEYHSPIATTVKAVFVQAGDKVPAGKLLMELDLAEAARDMLGAGKWLASSDRTAGDRVGIVGFCMGGALAIYAATLSDVFAAVVPFYPYMGVTAAAKPDVTKIKGAVLGHFAEKDGAYTHEQIDELERELRGAGIDVEFFWYSGADHAFFNDTRPEVFDPDAARLSWDRTRAFFRTHLATTVAPV